MRRLILSALVLVSAPAWAQSSPDRSDDPLPARRDNGIEKFQQDAERQRDEARMERIANPSTPQARQTLQTAAGCLARASAGEAADLLRMDFRTPQYRAKMDRLLDNNRSCVRGVRYMRSNRLLVAGDLAEHLLAAAPQRVNVRLAALPTDRVSTPRTPTDGVAMCVARSDPNSVGALFATQLASAEEGTAAAALVPALNACNRTGRALSASPAGLRSMLATATFRLLEGQEAVE